MYNANRALEIADERDELRKRLQVSFISNNSIEYEKCPKCGMPGHPIIGPMCAWDECYFKLNRVQNVEVSDTTKGDSSKEAGN
jgi:hypothetical protein